MSNDLIDSLLPNLDDTLGVRDSIGAVLHTVSILTRVWTGRQVGDGQASDTVAQILPSPGIKEFGHDLRLMEGGTIRQGDILVKGISKNKYPNEEMIDCSTTSPLIEKFYLIDDRIYTVISVKEGYLTWDVQVRKQASKARYGG